MVWDNANTTESTEQARKAFLMAGTVLEVDFEMIETSLGNALRVARKIDSKVPDPSLTDLINSIEDSIKCEQEAEKSLLG